MPVLRRPVEPAGVKRTSISEGPTSENDPVVFFQEYIDTAADVLAMS